MASASGGSLRHFVRRNALVVSAVALAAIVGLLIYAAHAAGIFGGKAADEQRATRSFFIDEESGEVEVRAATEIPPLVGKSGNLTLVVARYFTATTDNDKKLIYLERYTPEAKAALEATQNNQPATPEALEALRLGPQVRSPEPNSPWVYAQSPEGWAVMGAISALHADVSKVREVRAK